jgi:hypothetical protein
MYSYLILLFFNILLRLRVSQCLISRIKFPPISFFFFTPSFLFFVIHFSLFTLFSSCSVLHILPSKKVHRIEYDTVAVNRDIYFAYPDTTNDIFLRRLRTENGLLDVVKNAKNDTERALLLMEWTHRQWEHNGSNTPSKPDALTILAEARQGKQFRCVEYGTVLSSTLLSVGIKARQVGLQTKDVEKTRVAAGHVLAEVWLADLGKWAMIDGQFNLMPTLNGVPLNAVELQKAIVQQLPFEFINAAGVADVKLRKRYLNFIPHYLYFINTSFDKRTAPEKRLGFDGKNNLMLVPKGSQPPTVFQRKSPMNYLYYTTSIRDFYAQP